MNFKNIILSETNKTHTGTLHDLLFHFLFQNNSDRKQIWGCWGLGVGVGSPSSSRKISVEIEMTLMVTLMYIFVKDD